jgi:hypothetical protein
LLQIKINGKGDFLMANIISVKQDKVSFLTVDKTHAAFRKMQLLTQTDIPENTLVFTPNQQIRVRPD